MRGWTQQRVISLALGLGVLAACGTPFTTPSDAPVVTAGPPYPAPPAPTRLPFAAAGVLAEPQVIVGVPGIPVGTPASRLGIPAGWLPPAGACRAWVLGVAADQQKPAGPCTGALPPRAVLIGG